MMKVHARGLIVLLSAVCLASNASAQTSWWRIYGGTGGEQGYSVQQTSDSGYIVAGTAIPYGAVSFDVYLIKTDASGDTLWTRTYGGTQDEMGTSVQQTTDGGYIVTGFTSSFGAGGDDFYLIKTNASGETLWARTYGGTQIDMGASVQQTSDSGYLVGGFTSSFGAGARDVYLIKTNAQGETLWTRTYGGTNDDCCLSIQLTSDGGYIVAGYTLSFGAGGEDFYLIRTNTSGDTLWTRTYGGTGSDRGRSVQQTADGGYIVAGRTQSFGTGGEDVYLIKTDASGDTQWTRTYGGSSADASCSVQQASDGGYIIAGYTSSFGAGSYDVYLIKTDSLGNVGLAEESREPQAPIRVPAATVVRSFSRNAVAFDATGRKVVTPRSGILFVRDRSTVTKFIVQR